MSLPETNANKTAPAQHHKNALWHHADLHSRVYLGAGAALATALLLPADLELSMRAALAWCIGGLVYLALAFRTMGRCPVDRIKSRAARQDDGAIVILMLILVAVLSSLLAVTGMLSEARSATGFDKIAYVVAAASSIVIAWFVMQAVFTFHYAHEHYAPDNFSQEQAGGLEFPKDSHPDYWDFFYFATSIGAASQTADVSIVSKGLRRLVTLHAIVAFFFNTMVLALSINLAAGLIG